MKKSLRTCVAVLVTCLMVLEIPLFAFADSYAVAQPTSDEAVTEEADQDKDQADGDAAADNTGDSAQQEESSEETQPSQTEGQLEETTGTSSGGGESQTTIDMSKLLEQLQNGTAADQNTLTIPDAVKGGNYFFIANGNFSISEKSTQKLYVPIQRTGDLTQKAAITLKLVDITSHKGVNYTAEIYNEKVEGYNEYEDVSIVDIMKDNPDSTYETSGEVSEEEFDKMIAENGGKLDVLDSNDNVVGSITSSTPYTHDKTEAALSDEKTDDTSADTAKNDSNNAAADQKAAAQTAEKTDAKADAKAEPQTSGSQPEQKAEQSDNAGKDAADSVQKPDASNDGAGSAAAEDQAKDQPASDDQNNGQEDQKDQNEQNGQTEAPAQPDGTASDENSGAPAGADSEIKSDDQTASDETKTDEAKTEDQNKDQAAAENTAQKEKPVGLTGTGNPLKDARNQFTNTVSDRQELISKNNMLPANNGTDKKDTKAEEQLNDAATAATQDGVVDEEFPGTEYKLDFAAGEYVKYLEITPKYSEKAEGDSILMAMLRDPSEGFAIEDSTRMSYINIKDEDKTEEAFLSFSDSVITADGDKAVVTVTRSGAINNTITATLTSVDGSAKAGDDFSGVGAKLYFPMGVVKRTIEIPVGHGDEEANFYLRLVSPDGCSIVNDEVEVIITSNSKASLQSSAGKIGNIAVPDSYVRSYYDLSKATTCGNAWYDSSDGIFYASGKGQSNDTWHGMNLTLEKGYLYDGVRVISKLSSSKASNGFTTIAARDGSSNYSRFYTVKEWVDRYDAWTCDYIFGQTKSPDVLETRTVTTYWNGRTMGVAAVQPILRDFTFRLKPAATSAQGGLSFRGCTPAETAKYQSVIMNTDLTTSSLTIKSNGNFAITAIGTEYARLVGVDAISSDGRKAYRIANVNRNSRTVTVEANASTINALAENGLITWSSTKKELDVSKACENDYDEATSYSGTIYIRPVFEYIDSKLQVKPGTSGNLVIKNIENNKDKVYTSAEVVSVHRGDKLTITTNVTGDNADALGIRYEKSQSQGSGITSSGEYDYVNINGSYTYLVDSGYSVIEPTFNEYGNSVKVRVSDSDLAYFDTSVGMFKGLTPVHESGYYVYTVLDGAKVNDIVQLIAKTKSSSNIATWKDMRSDDLFSGEGFYYMAAAEAKNNIITLSVDTDDKKHSDYTVSGTLVTPVMNLSTGNYVENTSTYASNAVVVMSTQVTMADLKGQFSMNPFYALGGTKVRYAVSYNGGTELREIALPSADTKGKIVTYVKADGTQTTTVAIPVTSGNVNISEYSLTGAHFTAVNVLQDKLYVNSAEFLEMNGKKTVLQVEVHDGDEYTLNGETLKEEVTGVEFMFVDPKTNTVRGGAIKAEKANITINGEDGNTVTVWQYTFNSFEPPKKNTSDVSYNYGDVLYVRLITDRKMSADQSSDIKMEYRPVSTGFSVISDDEYEPQKFELEPDLSADTAFGNSESASTQDTKRSTYGQFPFMGEIQFVLKVAGAISKIDKRAQAEQAEFERFLEDWAEEDANSSFSDFSMDGGDAIATQSLTDNAITNGLAGMGLQKDVQVTVVAMFKTLPYGGTRLLLGVRFAMGTSGFSKINNPFVNAETATGLFGSISSAFTGEKNTISGPKIGTMGGAYAAVALQVGVYIDFGYIETETEYDDGTTEYEHSAVLLGGGVYIGGMVGVGAYMQTVIVVVPVYLGVSANVSTNIFLGITADPKKTLDDINSGEKLRLGSGGINLNLEWNTTVSVSGYAGIGIIGALGVRATITLSIDFGFSPNMAKFFPQVGSEWGLLSTFTAAGSVDFFGMSIPIASYTWALPGAQGYSAYFKEVRMGNIVIKYVNEGINEHINDSRFESVIASCKRQISELKEMIDSYSYTPEQIEGKTYNLREYAHDNDILSNWQYAKSQMYAISGLAQLASEDGEENNFNPLSVYVRDRSNSEWVAGNNGDISLQGTFEPKSTKTLLTNAYEQTSIKLIDLGDNYMLMVFLDTDTSRDGTQQAVLKYSVYDSLRDQWTLPEVIQDDNTGDTTPSLCDVGDDIMISWASADPVKYNKLTDEEKNDPTKIMSCYEIYTVLFNKKDRMINGEIEQLTDDEYCDSTPQGIYDSITHDRILLYLKTAPDTDYADSDVDINDKTIDYINPYSGKMYTVVTYMLYDHNINGWAHTYDYENEYGGNNNIDAAFIAKWKGQRFLPSVLDAKDDNKPTGSDEKKDSENDTPVVVQAGINENDTYTETKQETEQTTEPIEGTETSETEDNVELLSAEQEVQNEESAAFEETKAVSENDASTNENGDSAPAENENGNDANKEAESGSKTDDRAEEASPNDPYILDLAVCSGYNGIAVYAYTVDLDYDPDTTADKELYIQFYDFENHKNYVPVRLTKDKLAQSRPKLVRNDNNTYLFWLEGTDVLRYLNITALLNLKTKVEDEAGNEHYVIDEDGNVAEGYSIEPVKVDTHSVISDGTMNGIGSYEVFTDANNDLYVVWTCVEQRDTTDPNWDQNEAPAQEIYATALVREEDVENNKLISGAKTEDGKFVVPDHDGKESYARWSKPVKLTTNGRVNDGVYAALDSKGNLVIAYNQYDLTYVGNDPDFREKYVKTTIDENGKEQYIVTADPYKMSPIDLKSTKLVPAGSFEAVQFAFSDKTPVAGETITVAALMQNTGLTAVRGADVEFYVADENGNRIGSLIHHEEYKETILVNTSKVVKFSWTVPENFEGKKIMCVAKEKITKLENIYYPEKTTYSDAFEKKAVLEINIESAEQKQDDQFEITYSVTNRGNKASDTGLRARVELAALYGNIKDKYGLDDNKLFEGELESIAAKTLKTNEDETTEVVNTTKTFTETVTIPSSVFKYCGYDQVNGYIIVAKDKDAASLQSGEQDGSKLDSTVNNYDVINASTDNTDDQVYVKQDQPMNLKLNGGNDITLRNGNSVELKTTFDRVPILSKSEQVVYSVEDTNVATVENGVLTAVGIGTTKVKATVLPYGISTTVNLTVTAAGSSSGGSGGSSSATIPVNPIKTPDKEAEAAANGTVSVDKSQASAGSSVTITVKPDFGYKVDSVIVTDANGNKVTVNAQGGNQFTFNMPQTVASIEPVFKPYDADYGECDHSAACPADKYTDTDLNAWYHNGIHYAVENGLMNGTSDSTFAPKSETTRGMVATILNRIDGETTPSVADPFKDVQSGKYYADAIAWAAENGIVTGYDSNTFGPDDSVTREQVVAIMYRYTKYRKIDTSAAEATDISKYADAGSVSSYAQTAMKWACGTGIINGRSASQLAPKAKITRAELAQILLNYMTKTAA